MIGDDPPTSRRRGTPADKLGLCHEFEGASRCTESVTTFQQQDTGSTIRFLPRVALDWRRSYYAKASKDKLCLELISSPYPYRNAAETWCWFRPETAKIWRVL